jgi:hypothetical protein
VTEEGDLHCQEVREVVALGYPRRARLDRARHQRGVPGGLPKMAPRSFKRGLKNLFQKEGREFRKGTGMIRNEEQGQERGLQDGHVCTRVLLGVQSSRAEGPQNSSLWKQDDFQKIVLSFLQSGMASRGATGLGQTGTGDGRCRTLVGKCVS